MNQKKNSSFLLQKISWAALGFSLSEIIELFFTQPLLPHLIVVNVCFIGLMIHSYVTNLKVLKYSGFLLSIGVFNLGVAMLRYSYHHMILFNPPKLQFYITQLIVSICACIVIAHIPYGILKGLTKQKI